MRVDLDQTEVMQAVAQYVAQRSRFQEDGEWAAEVNLKVHTDTAGRSSITASVQFRKKA